MEFYLLDKLDVKKAIDLINRAEQIEYGSYSDTRYWLKRNKALAYLLNGDREEALVLIKELEGDYDELGWDVERDMLSDYTVGLVWLANGDTSKTKEYYSKAIVAEPLAHYGRYLRLQQEMDSILQTFGN